MNIQNVHDASFRPYGRVVAGIDCAQLLDALDTLPAPGDGVVYVPAEATLESLPAFKQFQDVLFGGMPTQLGYCNGTNHQLNAVEYHRDSEFNLAGTDMILLLGRQQDIDPDGYSYDTAKMEAFLCPRGTLIEFYGTTLHYAPASVGDGVFRCVVALPRGTNEPLPRARGASGEDMLLTHVNKWLIAHADSGMNADQAHIGLTGENLRV